MLSTEFPYDLAIPSLGMYTLKRSENIHLHKSLYTNVHGSIIWNSQDWKHANVYQLMNREAKCGMSIQWNFIWQFKKWSSERGFSIDEPWKPSLWVREARHKRNVAWVHLQEMSGIRKSIEMKNKLMVAQGWAHWGEMGSACFLGWWTCSKFDCGDGCSILWISR